MSRQREKPKLPTRVLWLIRGFKGYVRRFVRKNFHAVRISKSSELLPSESGPLVMVMNHPSWWDPMIVVVLSDLFPNAAHFGAIDAEAVKKYPIFQKLGFFPVDPHSTRGAAEFLRLSEVILAEQNHVMWLTAQGQFTDVRTRPLALRTGIGHLATRFPHIRIVPIAIEYSFWTEKTPEVLIRVGKTLHAAQCPERTAKEWTANIETELTSTLDILNAEVMTRDPLLFDVYHSGKVGVGGMYDRWRRLAAWSRGRRFVPDHADTTHPLPEGGTT